MQTTLDFTSAASRWKATPISQLPQWHGHKRIGVDIETHDPTLKEFGPGPRREGYIVGVAFAIDGGPSYYLPMRHDSGNLDPYAVTQYLQDQARFYTGQIVGANLSYDLDFLGVAGIHFKRAAFRDVLINDPLINELYDKYSLNAVAMRWGVGTKDMGDLKQEAQALGIKDAITAMARLPAHAVARHALCDVDLPLRILPLQEKEIAKQGLERVYDIECRLIPVLAAMRLRGVRVSESRLTKIEEWALAEEQKQLAIIQKATRVSICPHELWQVDLTAQALRAVGIFVGKTPSGKWNVDKEVLDGYDHVVTHAIARARKVNKLRTTFAASVRNHMTHGRIHCIFNQLAREESGKIKGARWGRISTEHPNLQQQPARDDFSKQWRAIYLPDGGGLWASCDYSQQEPRVVTHFACVAGCVGAPKAAKAYRDDPRTDNHQLMAELTGLPRKQAKNIYLGLCYGMGGAKLAISLGLPTVQQKAYNKVIEIAGPEAQAILDKFDMMAPFVRELFNKTKTIADERGYIKTLLGRRCRFPADSGGRGGYIWTRDAMNKLVQGSAADQTKMAMVLAHEAGIPLQLQVHDELDLTVSSPAEAHQLAAIMRDALPLVLPSRVDAEVGASWGEAE